MMRQLDHKRSAVATSHFHPTYFSRITNR
jgi:hypothetical protein